MSFFSNRRAARSASKWHDQVAAAVGGALPAPIASSRRNLHLFPYAQLQAITKEYLGKKKRSQQEQDELLIDLIQQHDCREVAFAACATFLSTGQVDYLLNNAFEVDSNSFQGLERYLHAFVAAAQCKESLGLIQDRNFAVSLVPVAREVTARGISQYAVKSLLVTWSYGPPAHKLLLTRARSLTRSVFQQVQKHLDQFTAQLALDTLNRQLLDTVVGYRYIFCASNEPDDSVTSYISCWRGWISWTPDVTRLQRWADVRDKDIFACLIELEGPDLRPDDQNCGSQWQALVQRGQLLEWLESKGFTLGIDLITGDSAHLLSDFTKRFLGSALESLQTGSSRLLQYIIKKDGLDMPALRAWHAARSMLQPEFIHLLFPGSTSGQNDLDGIVLRGLKALAADVTQSVRKPFNKEIAKLVRRALENVLSTFKSSFAAGEDWVIPAGRLWTLRSSIAASGWLHSTLDSGIVAMCRTQAPHHSLSTLRALHNAAVSDITIAQPTLRNSLDVYVQSFVVGGKATSDRATALPDALHTAWLYSQRENLRYVSLFIASIESMDVSHRLGCIKRLQGVADDLIQDLMVSMDSLSMGTILEIMRLTITIKTLEASYSEDQCWRALFLRIVKRYDVRGDAKDLLALGYSGYRQCIESIHELVGGEVMRIQSIHTWLEQLRPVESILEMLETSPDSEAAVHCILAEQQPEIRKRHLKTLQCLTKQRDAEKFLLLHELVLALRQTNSAQVSQAVMAISKVDAEGFAQCQELLTICHADKNVGAVRLAIWLQMGGLDDATQAALSSLGKVLNLGLDNDMKPPSSAFEAARKDYAKRVAELVARTQQLERTRMSSSRTDPNGVKAMVKELGLEAPSGAASLVAGIPTSLTNVIRENGEDEVELTFRLSTEMNAMEHLAFGLEGDETLAIHLQIDVADKFDAFCVHVTRTRSQIVKNHKFYKSKSVPDRLYCGEKLTRLHYVVSRNLWRAIHERGETSLQALYEGIQAVMHGGASRCIVCGGSIGAQLLRGTMCNSPSCRQAYLRSPLDLRLQDVRSDGRVVDLLVTSAVAVANSRNLALLPGFPAQLNDPAKLQNLLNSLPTTKTLARATDFQTGLQGCGQRAELLLSWLCTSYRGFIVSATGPNKIPNMGNIHQFLVVNSAPEIEAAFARHDHMHERHILFHGTSMDRLYAILSEGLKICSSTMLQKHGAASGAGIYTAREPSVSMGYAGATQTNATMNGFFNSRPDFRDSSILLGLEHAGTDPSGSGIHIIKDPTRIMVRYVFLVPPGTSAPRSQDVVPAMLKTIHGLRAAAAAKSAEGAGPSWATADQCCVM